MPIGVLSSYISCDECQLVKKSSTPTNILIPILHHDFFQAISPDSLQIQAQVR